MEYKDYRSVFKQPKRLSYQVTGYFYFLFSVTDKAILLAPARPPASAET